MNWMKTTAAYFISPHGEVIEVRTSHIAEVIGNPGLFGVTTDEIQESYGRHGEKIGSEGKAREEILLRLIEKGWVRIRRYPRYWSITVGNWSSEASRSMSRWAERILGPGISGRREADPHMPVRINGFKTAVGSRELLTIQRLAEGISLREISDSPAEIGCRGGNPPFCQRGVHFGTPGKSSLVTTS
ncbi:MAG TPA: hypothetical protein VK463_21190 [Desulfomonilaceae bacterium]|nr:hypothetical protein [Desulfomonilaceae bacterium]